jgi:nucleotide-binding universal stress UspA family protein
MYKRILVPLDGSSLAEGILPYVHFLAPVLGAEVDLLRVTHPTAAFLNGGETYISGDLYQQIIDADTEAATDYLNVVAERVRAEGVKVQIEVVFDQPANAIIDAAHRAPDTLVMMTTHGRTGLGRFALGSVAELVVRESAAPVFLVRALEERPTTFESVLVPLDGSATSEAVLPCVEALAPVLKSSVYLVRIPTHEDVTDATDYLTAIAERLRAAGISEVHTRVRPGAPDEAIVDLAKRENVGFIAMATHGRSGLRRWVLGSVTDKVVHTTTAPMLIIRAPEAVAGKD